MNNQAGGFVRPKTVQSDEKIRVSLSLKKSTLSLLDNSRGGINRSQYIEEWLKDSCEIISPQQERKLNGAVYTPKILSDYVATKVLQILQQKEETLDLPNMKILDPACGDGELLSAIWDKVSSNPQITSADHILYGLDINEKAIKGTQNRIGRFFIEPSRVKNNFLCENALFPQEGSASMEGWKCLLKKFDIPNGFDVVIANPPWGADISSYREYFTKGEFSLFQQQVDTAELFLELAFSITRDKGYIAFILPDSIFNHEKSHVREFILKNSNICFIARLGEKIFSYINRACSVIICQKSRDSESNQIECLRLTPDFRKKILEGAATFEDAEKALSHIIPQKRFYDNKQYFFDIDLQRKEEKIFQKLRNTGHTFKAYLDNARGIELSKSGQISQCTLCEKWFPKPNKAMVSCPHCKKDITSEKCKTEKIVSKEPVEGYSPLIVGETIRRYQLENSFWIDTGRNGIQYKNDDTYIGPKLLVRKTGVGISATIDYSHSYTNQVVYIFRTNDRYCDIPLEFFIGILNSRALFYYLIKCNGEMEWRSHPYVTQKQILDLPIPAPEILLGKDGQRLVQLISTTVKEFLTFGRMPLLKEDAEIEKYVADLYGLNKNDYQMIFETLDSAEQLIPMKALRSLKIEEIFGE